MTRTVLDNGKIRLQSEAGIIDTRTKKTHHDVVCSVENEKYFVEAEITAGEGEKENENG